MFIVFLCIWVIVVKWNKACRDSKRFCFGHWSYATEL